VRHELSLEELSGGMWVNKFMKKKEKRTTDKRITHGKLIWYGRFWVFGFLMLRKAAKPSLK
jgi:hypothetical protein